MLREAGGGPRRMSGALVVAASVPNRPGPRRAARPLGPHTALAGLGRVPACAAGTGASGAGSGGAARVRQPTPSAHVRAGGDPLPAGPAFASRHWLGRTASTLSRP